MPKATSIGRRTAGALLAAGCVALSTAAPAAAGSYRAAVCHAGLGAGRAEAVFGRSSRHYLDRASCAAGGPGLSVSLARGAHPQRQLGSVVDPGPRGTAISRLSVYAAGRRGAGAIPELGLGNPGGQLTPLATPRRELQRVTWSGPGVRAIAARLRCLRTSGCGDRAEARVRIKRLVARLGGSRRANPEAGGLALRARKQARPTDHRTVGRRRRRRRAAVTGAGERRAGHRTNIVLQPRRPDRAPASSLSRREPAPASGAATASAPFRQGPNLVRVCAADYAPSTAANRACAQRRVRVDNLCPVSEVSRGAQAPRPAAPAGDRAPSSPGACSTAAGGASPAPASAWPPACACAGPPSGCATPLTDADGALPGHDPAAVRAARCGSPIGRTRSARARALSRPRGPGPPAPRLRPRHPMPTATGVRFRVRLPGPATAGRRVRIQARAGRRWLDLRQRPHRTPGHLPRALPLPRDHRPPQLRLSRRGAEAARLSVRGRPVQGEARHGGRLIAR